MNENMKRGHEENVESDYVETSGESGDSSFAESAEKPKHTKIVLKPGAKKTPPPEPKKDEEGFEQTPLTKGQKKAARKARQKLEKKNRQLEMKKIKFGDDFIDPDLEPGDDETYGPPPKPKQ